ncbi:His-Xaa-Ser system radical SAM maturase HxsC [Arachidicoccus sp.]|uniref:His-Xaa-Ser system radical SAM maturase HxsC n=1 Tax=Arachidicoccus sp. TaxID=1872624 RepID=UPI003D1DE672
MLLKTRGTAFNINESIVGRVTRNQFELDNSSFLICEDELPERDNPFIGVLTKHKIHTNAYYSQPIVSNVPNFDHLSNGDIVVVNEDGTIRTLYRANSHHNVLFVTERCNSNCLMCSQPPKDKDDISRLYKINQKLISLIPKDCFELVITGGEPTLLGELFFKTLETLKEQLPKTEIHVLTNGRSFAWRNMAERLSNINYNRVMFGIPLYADYYQVHDYIVQAKDAFNQTILGLHNLARYNQRIEIRIVLHKQSVPRLTRLSKYIYKNLPFAQHITFMGLEYIGYTPHNIDKLWIDPHDYIDELNESVEFLAGQGMQVSIYNSQLCVLPQNLWKYCRKSISDWKNSYLPICQSCTKLNECGGLFTWNLDKHSDYINPFLV